VWQDLQSAINTVLESKSLASVLRAYPSVVPPLGAKATYHLIGGPKRKSTPKEENEAREHSSKEQLAMEESAAEKSGLL
jgi:hypothetical protein